MIRLYMVEYGAKGFNIQYEALGQSDGVWSVGQYGRGTFSWMDGNCSSASTSSRVLGRLTVQVSWEIVLPNIEQIYRTTSLSAPSSGLQRRDPFILHASFR